MEPEDRWQPIETAPKDGTLIIAALIKDGRVWRVSDAGHNGLSWYTRAGNAIFQPTHWMPLPDPPKESRMTPSKEVIEGCDVIGGFPYADPNCKGCGKLLAINNAWMTDGCSCNSALGINSMNETRWRLLIQLQQRQAIDFAALQTANANLHNVCNEYEKDIQALQQLKQENERLKQEAADDLLAFGHANEIIEKYEQTVTEDRTLLRELAEALRLLMKNYHLAWEDREQARAALARAEEGMK